MVSKHDSCLSGYAPMRQSFELNINTLLHKNTLEVPTLTPGGHLKSIKRKPSSKTSASYFNKAAEKAADNANNPLVQSDEIDQKPIPDLPPEEPEDSNIERMRMTKQRESLRREKDLLEK